MKYTLSELHDEWDECHDQASKIVNLKKKQGEETTYDELSEVTGFDYWEVRDDMKNWDALGLVRKIKGSRGHPSRVVWRLPSKEVGRILKGGFFDPPTGNIAEGRIGKLRWTLQEILEVLSHQSGLAEGEIQIDLKIPEVKKILANSQGIEVADIEVRMG